MAQGIVAFVIIGIMTFLLHAMGGTDLIFGVSRIANHTEVETQPIFEGMSVYTNMTITNDNDYTIGDMRVRCSVNSRSNTLLKNITKTVHEVIQPKSSVTINRFFVTNVLDYPKSLDCRVIRFATGTTHLAKVIANKKAQEESTGKTATTPPAPAPTDATKDDAKKNTKKNLKKLEIK